MKKLLFLLAFLLSIASGYAQVGINTTTPDAQLDIKSSNQATPTNTDGILIPKIDAFPVTNPTAAQNSMMVYLTTTSAGKQPGFYYWDNATTSWKGFGNGSGWNLTGNSGTTPGTNFVGTTDDKPLIFKTNNIQSGYLGGSDNYAVFFGHRAGEINAGFWNVGIGSYALNLNTWGSSNVAIGQLALNKNTTGYSNFALGTVAMNDNTIGNNNVAIGEHTLDKNVTGSYAVAIGSYAMQYANDRTTPFENKNVAVGYQSQMGSTTPTNNTGSLNTSVGYQTLANISYGSNNTAVGSYALNLNDGGYGNSAFGQSALSINTGSSNTAMGARALILNTTGVSNTANGVEALYGNNTGSNNVAIGNSALHDNIAGSNAVAIGKSAMVYSNNTTTAYDNHNVAIGFESLRGSTTPANNTGNFNTAIGYQTLLNNSTGQENSAIGDQALLFNATGRYNTATGRSSLSSNVSGYYNTATGYAALGNTTGEQNTAIGATALYNNSTGSGNVAIGYNAGYNELGSNKLYIENSNSATPLIYGEFNNDIVKINGQIKVNRVTTVGNEMQINNANNYVHGNGNQIFGNGSDEFLMSSRESSNETAGIYGDGNAVSIWSPGDGNQGQAAALVYFLDEDFFDGSNTNPYDNTALKSYISPAGAYVQISDKNKKENIVKIENALEKINQINGYTYQFKLAPAEVEKGDKPIKSSGVLAQELKEVLPEAVQQSDNGDYFVDYAAITPLLIEALKEQNKKIQTLEQRLKTIEEKIGK
ncbi:MAG: tail fiber domain-containing protein [Bacteroidetes bacterium]|uniref:tail fiber domain-containing protein n=1 Tax=Flavobacterium sp. TaxID=239 RepID=UPI002FDAFEA3|nr:tail fiber domain-containing protein [Bacteroidota bacterium]